MRERTPIRQRLTLCALAWCLAFVGVLAQAATSLDVPSPDGRLVLTFDVQNLPDAPASPVYSLKYRGQPILLPSRLGLRLADGTALDAGLKVVSTRSMYLNDTWHPVAGERSTVRSRCRELAVVLQDTQTPPRRLRLTFRVFDEGAALSYSLPTQGAFKEFTLVGETTEFRFAADHPCWAVYSAQGIYTNQPLSRLRPGCERPLVLEVKDGPVVALGEARLVDYARMRLKRSATEALTLVPDLAGPVAGSTPFTSPWRFLMVADSPGQLLERNDFILNLNEPCAIADPSWIEPGKVIRETTLSTTGGLACVDFAVRAGLQYIEFDAGWYGPENSDASDARFVNVNTNRPQGGLNLPRVLAYAKEHGIGVLLYVNRRELERRLDELLPLYQRWGVRGIKFGFVHVGSQKWTAWLHEAVRQCAQHNLLVDVHDEYRPTGWSRTYPNLLTQEGVRGNEEMPPAWHNLVLPFTRFLCGPADTTICWNDQRIQTSHAHQLAAGVVFYSPLQFLYWYDRPEQFQGEPELEFFRHLPSTWDDTRVLHGVIGQHITMARRKGEEWFVGTLNARERRTLDIPLRFLVPGQKYTASIYGDAQPEGGASRRVAIEERAVDAQTVLRADLADNGGQALRIRPASP